jgi:hypothetical protein
MRAVRLGGRQEEEARQEQRERSKGVTQEEGVEAGKGWAERERV